MPSVVNMDNSSQSGARTDHDANPKANGVNGAGGDASSNGAVTAAPGDKGGAPEGVVKSQAVTSTPEPALSRMNDLPDEIVHITDGFVPLSLLLTRLAQSTHNSLQDKIAELAKMPIPATAAAVNGNSAHTAADDTSSENLRKKQNLLNFAQESHGKWVKALVIAEWSRKSEMVSKLIDLKWHIDQQRILYDSMLDQIVHVKRDMTFARMPSPDLKTALQVLSTGSAPWMPDLQYIEPPPLTIDEQLKWMNELNTLLSLRLNIDEFDKIPPQFKYYEIESGRVTFKVKGEFEVDLTIADEDFDKQFWFIDFRFAFKPSASALPETLRGYMEGCVNEALAKDGLKGCYEFLHEFVLTYKINELKRQALQLSKAAWTGTLKVEPLHRALAIQYWTSRLPPTNPKSWVLIAVNSGQKQKVPGGEKPSSFLEAKWYRDTKEVTDVDITLDMENLSAEALLRNVVGRHIESILQGYHDKLLEAPRYKDRKLGIALHISQSDPGSSRLITQVTRNTEISLLIEPKTGAFALKPPCKFTAQQELKLNSGAHQIEGGVAALEDARCAFVEDEIHRLAGSVGWVTLRAPLKDEELKAATKMRDWTKTVWLQQKGWGPNWYIVVCLSLRGDEWWLLEADTEAANRGQRFTFKLPLDNGHPALSERFWSQLTTWATGIIAQSIDGRELHRQCVRHRAVKKATLEASKVAKLPTLDIELSAIFPAMVYGSVKDNQPEGHSVAPGGTTGVWGPKRGLTTMSFSPRRPWANDIISLGFIAVQPQPRRSDSAETEPAADRLVCVSEAVIKVRQPEKLAALKGRIDHDVIYNPKIGEFRLRLRHAIGEPSLATLKSRITAIDRFICFLEALEKAKDTIKPDKVALRAVSCWYGERTPQASEGGQDSTPQRLRVLLDLSSDEITVKLEKGNPHLRVIDLMRRLVNLSGGIQGLLDWLSTSLPTMAAIEDIETKWEDIHAKAQGEVNFAFKTLDWMSIRYTIAGTDQAGQPVRRQLILEGQVRNRNGAPWWHICRADDGSQEDPFGTALKPIWQGRGQNWQGLNHSAAGTAAAGAALLLHAIDDAVRGLVGKLDGSQGFSDTSQKQKQQPSGSVPQQAIEIS